MVQNKENELLSTCTVTGWRVCIDYRCEAPKFGGPLITHQPMECLWILCNSILHRCVLFIGIHNLTKNWTESPLYGELYPKPNLHNIQ